MKNFIQPGNLIFAAAPYDRLSGQGALIGSMFGVATNDTLNGVTGEWAVRGVFELTKTNSQAWTVGAKIYWDDTAHACTTVAMSNTLIGVATEAVASTAGLVVGRVLLGIVA